MLTYPNIYFELLSLSGGLVSKKGKRKNTAQLTCGVQKCKLTAALLSLSLQTNCC